MTMLVSYWDAGWILLDVTDPARPTVVRDHDFPSPNIAGVSPPEGNAHQAFWSSDRRFVIASSEDFAPFRLSGDIVSGPFAGQQFNTVVASNTRAITPQQPLIGGRGGGRPPRGGGLPTYYVGLACDPLPQAPTTNAVALVQRGTCTFAVKGQNVQAAGYTAGLVFNSAAVGNCEGASGMSVTERLTIPLIGVVPRSLGFAILGVSGYNPANCPTGANPSLPAVGTRGADILIESEFDAWGYVHLLDGATFREIGQYAVPEALTPGFSTSFGRLSVHEVKTDSRPGMNLAYVSYYDAGARVLQFGPGGIREVGSFIDVGGNNFWGTFPHYLGTDPNIRPIAQTTERPLLLFSDKDYGLYILRYTGPESAP
ncbi:MAG: hypothetical protein H0U03_13380 [Actinobacteria bacterium]|nr:hypothetical protein [Actinomycetota bacterium]